MNTETIKIILDNLEGLSYKEIKRVLRQVKLIAKESSISKLNRRRLEHLEQLYIKEQKHQ